LGAETRCERMTCQDSYKLCPQSRRKMAGKRLNRRASTTVHHLVDFTKTEELSRS
jgi:L-amino acid N-acyltransferase YncA